jgi:hypothetical protein
MIPQLSGSKILRSTRGWLRRRRKTAPAAEVPAPPAFRNEVTTASMLLNKWTNYLDGPISWNTKSVPDANIGEPINNTFE